MRIITKEALDSLNSWYTPKSSKWNSQEKQKTNISGLATNRPLALADCIGCDTLTSSQLLLFWFSSPDWIPVFVILCAEQPAPSTFCWLLQSQAGATDTRHVL